MFDQVLWFATRGAGAASLLFLTASVSLGPVTVTRFAAAGGPRLFSDELYRRILPRGTIGAAAQASRLPVR
ncbi:MAG: hypothetical protein WCK58_09785 [Chloroflexota bacterium]